MKQPLFSVAMAALALTTAVLSSSTSSYADDADSVLGLPSSTGTAATLPGGQPNGPPPTSQQAGLLPNSVYGSIYGWCLSYGVPGITNNLAYSFSITQLYNNPNYTPYILSSGSISLPLGANPATHCATLARAACNDPAMQTIFNVRQSIDIGGNTSFNGFRYCGTF